MSSASRDSSRDRELVLRHQASYSDSGRSSVPMWDSSDPERAPPPLPLNPGTPGSPVTKSNTSATVAAAAEALAAKARESSYPTSPTKSPERSLIKGHHHRRMQSLQTGNAVRDLSSYLENRSPERSPERPLKLPIDIDTIKLGDKALNTPTPIGKDIPSLRPSSRPGLKAILGETAPQSDTMRALQSTPKNEDEPLPNTTNHSTALVRTPHAMDAISNQILGLTSICTRLQQEMAALSRRSKDNATDLVSLKEATCSRDEDIRKSLKDLITNLNTKTPELEPEGESKPRFMRSVGSYPSMSKSMSLPRIPSPADFASSLDREMFATSSPYSVDGAAAIALLEKILREMGTKEGQEKLLSSVSDISVKSGSDSRISKHLEEVIGLLKEQSTSQALVRAGTQPNFMERQQNLAPMQGQEKPYSSPRAADFVSEDILKLLKRMKDSIAEGGGMSAELKSLVRELRGEVLGMGREIGRKLDQSNAVQQIENKKSTEAPRREEISKIVDDGLADLKQHMDRVMQEHRRQSASSFVSRSAVDSQEVYAAVKGALKDMPMPQQQGSGIEREEILEAVREAWETYKPEIELQNFGLERDEILQCLKEGLEDYKPKDKDQDQDRATTYDEVLDAVKEGLKEFQPPKPDTEASLTREEILETVRECLETFDFPAPIAASEKGPEVSKEDVLEAVRESLLNQPALAKEIEFNREDLFDAVRAGLEEVHSPMANVSEQIMEKMQDLIEGMKGEFQQYSAANGRDTEQVLDAMKDGLEVLRSSVEGYVDKAADVTGKDEIIDTVRSGLDTLRADLEASIADIPQPTNTNSTDLLDAMEREFEHLRSTISSSVTRNEAPMAGREEILDAIREGFDELPKDNKTDDVKEELRHLRETLATTITRRGDTFDRDEILETIREGIDKAQLGLSKDNGRPESILSNTSELIEHFNDGLENLKADVERIVNKPIDMTVNYEILEALRDGLASVRKELDGLKFEQNKSRELAETNHVGGEMIIADEQRVRGLQKPDIENLEVMITQLKIKVESLDDRAPPEPAPTPAPAQPVTQVSPATVHVVPEDALVKGDLERFEIMMKDMQDSVTALMEREHIQLDNTVSKEDTDAIETLLRNTKDRLEEMPMLDPELALKVEHFEILETLSKNTRDSVEDLMAKYDNDAINKEELASLEVFVREVQTSVQDIKEKLADEPASKTDLDALATICTEYQERMKEAIPESLPSKEDLDSLRELVHEFKEKFDIDAEMTAQAFDARKTEHGGLADKIEDVKAFLESVRKELKETLEGSGTGIQELSTSLSAIGEAVMTANSVATIGELKELLDREFERAQIDRDATKTDFEQQRDILVEKHDEYKQAVIEDLTSKIDARFDELMTKYDDAQAAADGKASTYEDKANDQAEAIASAKAVTDDLKLLVDTLGTTVTESCERIGEDTRTVFAKVEEVNRKAEETVEFLRVDSKADHQMTRAEISKTLVAVESLQAHGADFNPKIMAAIGEILNVVGRHYEEGKRTSEEIRTSVRDIPNIIPMPALPALQDVTDKDSRVEKYDDAEVQSKLDKLVESSTQFELLEEIKSQIATTHADFQSFMDAQQATLKRMQESRSREAEEASIALERKSAEKQVVESDIVHLTDERRRLEASVADLKREKDELSRERREIASSKAKLQADVSSLETALQIRREEMQIMEERAESLEKRIIDGVLDHSRSILLSSRPSSSLKSMNLKRVTSNTSSNITVTTKSGKKSVPNSAVSSAVGVAIKKRHAPNGSSPASPANRRILSLSTLNANKGNDKPASLATPSSISSKSNNAFGAGLKRSHSVKSNFPTRKTSWGGTKQIGMYGDEALEEDKENSLLEEEDEDGSESGTERRSSYTGTYTGTEESYGTESLADSEDRRTSFAGSVAGTIDGYNGGANEANSAIQLYQQSSVGIPKDVVLYGTDSGLGSDPPTAALEAGGEYFKSK